VSVEQLWIVVTMAARAPLAPPDPDPAVTIVIPTWNRADFVRQAVASVIGQTWRDWELIVVDDGSEDDTVARLQAMADPRVRVLALEHSGNVARLRNLGVAAGSGALLAFLDSDDLWLPHKLERQIDALRTAGAGYCYSSYAHVDANGRPVAQRAGAFRADSGRILPALLREKTAAYIGTLLVERVLFESIGGFDESLTMRADLDFTFRLAAVADAAVDAEVLMQVREHPGRITGQIADPHERSALVFEKFLKRETDGELRALARMRLAGLLTDAGARRIAAGEIAQGLALIGGALGRGFRPAYAARRIVAALRAWMGAVGR
jgi:glycosyltransferase involved in cell wall biosynthesis